MTDDLQREGDQIQASSDERIDEELVAGEAQEAIGQAQSTVVLNRPAAGQSVVTDYVPGQTMVLGFNPAAARVLIEGDSLVLGFDDNGNGTPDSRLIFENLVSAQGANSGPIFAPSRHGLITP